MGEMEGIVETCSFMSAVDVIVISYTVVVWFGCMDEDIVGGSLGCP